ncbi:uncharacterized protein [Cardiocondyla obscurior]|uniref:uncharacterized protein n=1 Tax=Cardiocondyla obscurior TaxID=286306 RepID=UPI00396588A2
MDDKCLAWSVVAALYPAKQNVNRESSYPHYTTVLNVEGVQFPAILKDVARLERLNDISINVYATERCGKEINVLLVHLTNEKKEKHVNLFSSEKFKFHIVDCGTLNNCAIRLPSEDNKWLSFSNHDNKERVPFIVYADLKCVLRKIDPPSSPEQTTFNYQRHEVFSVGYYVRCSFDELLSRYEYRRGLDCIEWFVEQLVKLAHRVKTIILKTVPMETLSNAQREKHENATVCHVYESPFEVDEKRVRDHCHLTGRYRGPAHSKCNLRYCDTRYIPVVFHNLSGYDAHFVIKEITTAYEDKVDLLPITKKKYISFTKHVNDTAKGQDLRTAIKLRFIDSYKFLNASLDKLSYLLIKDKMQILCAEFATLSEENFDLLTRKGIFPYEYVNSVERLDELSLPSRESFFSSLTGDTVSETDYAHAETVWQQFSVRTLGEYSDLYLKTNVLLLADVFENFHDRCVESYGFDPAHYYTLPGFTWDAMLKHTRINFELLTDIDMVMFVERGICGGLSQCSNRYARANNRYMRSGRSVFAENLVAVELRKLEVKFAKPIYVGMSILDIFKECLYEFHHEYMLSTFEDKCSVMYTDTDSLVYSDRQ